MAYQVLARKWRPARFGDVIGQEHVTRTLQNAIAAGRVSHAYLFVGPRGIGKTTTARIFAKALNCLNPQVDGHGKPEPCCQCSSCQEIAAGHCLDVIEIDGASHNKVEDVREICENIQYTPSHGRKYKIYIIDEIHMLTTQAWNALLKTLEEPPDHAKFLFATTEAHKVLPTILSRTQRFDLRKIPPALIAKQLRVIANTEKIFISDKALNLIARAADGGMRDAQSILDQLIAFRGGTTSEEMIQETDVSEIFGLTSVDHLREILKAIATKDTHTLISLIHFLADRGRDLEKLYVDLLEEVRNFLILKITKEPERILSFSPSEIEELKRFHLHLSPAQLQQILELMLRYGDKMRHVLNKRIFLEVTLLEIMDTIHSPKLEDVIALIEEIHKKNPNLGLPTSLNLSTPSSTNIPHSSSLSSSSFISNLSLEKKSSPGSPSPYPSSPSSDTSTEKKKMTGLDSPLHDQQVNLKNNNQNPTNFANLEKSFQSLGEEDSSSCMFSDEEAETSIRDDGIWEDDGDHASAQQDPSSNFSLSNSRNHEDLLSFEHQSVPTKIRSAPEKLEEVKKHPWVQKTIKLFDGRLIDVKLIETPSSKKG